MNEYSLTIIHSFAARKPARRGCQEDRRMIARQIAIGFGVAIVFPLLVYYGVSTVSPAPRWSNFHEQVVYAPNPTRDELAAPGEAKGRDRRLDRGQSRLQPAPALRRRAARLSCDPVRLAARGLGSGNRLHVRRHFCGHDRILVPLVLSRGLGAVRIASRSDGRARLRRIPPILQRHRSPSAGFDAWTIGLMLSCS